MAIKGLVEKWAINILIVDSICDNADDPYAWELHYSYNPQIYPMLDNNGNIKYFNSELDAKHFILSGEHSYGDCYQISKVYIPVYEH